MTRMKIIFTVEFEVEETWYEAGISKQEILNIEIKNANNDPIEFISNFNENIVVTGELV